MKVQKEVDDLYDRSVEEYKIKLDVTEELEQNDPMKWDQMMNDIKSCVAVIINEEIIYADIFN